MSTAVRVRFLTGRCNVSKTNNKSGKVSPDLDTPTDLPAAAVEKISTSLNTLLADAFALYLKTKNFHWHVSGRHFRDYHLMLDEQSEAIFATTDQLLELFIDETERRTWFLFEASRQEGANAA